MWSLRTSSWKPSGVVSRFVRKVRTASGAVAVQVVTRRGRQVERIEHVGSAHTDAELALLLAAARERLSPGQDVLDLGDLPVVPARMDEVADWTGEQELPLQPAAGGRPTSVAAGGRVVGTSADLLWAVLTSGYAQLGFDVLGDDGFRAMVLARIVEPTSKAEVVRVLDEIGAPAVSLRTLFRSLARSQARDYRGQLATAAWAHSVRTSGTAALVLYDVTVRHEALVVRVGVRDHHRGRGRSQGREAGGSLTGETTGRAGAALTKPYRVSTAGWRECGERAEEVYARNRCHHLS